MKRYLLMLSIAIVTAVAVVTVSIALSDDNTYPRNIGTGHMVGDHGT